MKKIFSIMFVAAAMMVATSCKKAGGAEGNADSTAKTEAVDNAPKTLKINGNNSSGKFCFNISTTGDSLTIIANGDGEEQDVQVKVAVHSREARPVKSIEKCNLTIRTKDTAGNDGPDYADLELDKANYDAVMKAMAEGKGKDGDKVDVTFNGKLKKSEVESIVKAEKIYLNMLHVEMTE